MDLFNAETTGKEVIEKLGNYAHGKTYLITGTSDKGFGSEVAVTLATAKPKLLILASRNEAKVSPVIDAIKAIDPTVEAAFLHLDLLHNASVRAAVTQIKTLTSRVDGLVNNAGIMAPRTYAASKDGVESQFATNYLSHFLLTNLLLKEGLVNFDDLNFNDGKDYNGWKAYGQSKTAGLLFTFDLGQKLARNGVPVLAVHPGVSLESQLLANSAIDQEYFGEAYKLAIERNDGNPLPPQHMRSLTQGAATIIAGLLDPSIRSQAPVLLVENDVLAVLPYAHNPENEEKLWALSEKLVGEKFVI